MAGLNNLLLSTKRTVALGTVAAGATVQTTAILDMQGFEGALFEINLGTLTAGQTLGTLQVQAGTLSNGSDMANLVGAAITVADASASKSISLEVYKVSQGMRYIQLVFTRNSQAAQILCITVTQYGDRKHPESEDTSFAQALIAVEPQYTNTQLTNTTTTYPGSTTQVNNTYRSAS